jgi:hypothetical protein
MGDGEVHGGSVVGVVVVLVVVRGGCVGGV